MTELGEFAMYLALGATMVTALLGPIGKAIGRRLEGRSRGGEDHLAEVEARLEELETVQARLDNLESGQARTAELENRLDFAERMLSERARSLHTGLTEGSRD